MLDDEPSSVILKIGGSKRGAGQGKEGRKAIPTKEVCLIRWKESETGARHTKSVVTWTVRKRGRGTAKEIDNETGHDRREQMSQWVDDRHRLVRKEQVSVSS